jgi:hypothetical protein
VEPHLPIARDTPARSRHGLVQRMMTCSSPEGVDIDQVVTPSSATSKVGGRCRSFGLANRAAHYRCELPNMPSRLATRAVSTCVALDVEMD